MDFIHSDSPPILGPPSSLRHHHHHHHHRRIQDNEAIQGMTTTTSPTSSIMAPTMAPSVSMAPTPTPLVTSTDSMIIQETLSVYGSFYILCFILFCLLRKHVPRLYNIRSWVPELKCDLALQSMETDYDNEEGWLTSYVSWTWKVYQVSDDDMLRQCGMDALCFLRCLRLGWRLSLFGVFNSLWLIPLYVTAKSSPETEYLTDKFVVASVANVPAGSNRILFVVVGAYLMVFYTLHILSKEYAWYIEMRHKFLSQRLLRNYTIYVSGIPPEFRNSFALREYFANCSWNSAVVEAHIAMDMPRLEGKVARRAKVIATLEHVLALEKRQGKTQTHHARKQKKTSSKISSDESVETTSSAQHRRSDQSVNSFLRTSGVVIPGMTEKVDTVEVFQKELVQLNHDISLAIGRMHNSNHRLRHHLMKSAASTNVLRQRRDLHGPSSSLTTPNRNMFQKHHIVEDIIMDLSPIQSEDSEVGGVNKGAMSMEEAGRSPPTSPPAGLSRDIPMGLSKDVSLRTVGTAVSNLSGGPSTGDIGQPGQLKPIIESFDATGATTTMIKTDDIEEGSLTHHNSSYDDDNSSGRRTTSETDPSEESIPSPLGTPNSQSQSHANGDRSSNKQVAESSTVRPENSAVPPPSTPRLVRQNSPLHPFLQLFGFDSDLGHHNALDDTAMILEQEEHQHRTIEKILDSCQTDEEYAAAIQDIQNACSQEEMVFVRASESEDDGKGKIEKDTDSDDHYEVVPDPVLAEYKIPLAIDHRPSFEKRDSRSSLGMDSDLESGEGDASFTTPSESGKSRRRLLLRRGSATPSDGSKGRRRKLQRKDSAAPSDNSSKSPSLLYRRGELGDTALSKRVQSGRRLLGDAGQKSKDTLKKSMQLVEKNANMVVGGVRKVADAGVSGVQKVAELGEQFQPDSFLGATFAEGKSFLTESAAVVAPQLLRHLGDGQPREAGFVVFRDLYTTQAARQMLQHPSADQWVVEPAPAPEDVFWRNVGLSAKAKSSGRLMSLAASVGLCLFWSLPSAFLSSLTEVNSLKTKLPLLARWTQKVSWLENGLALVAPALLLLLNECVLPSILKIFSTWEGHIGAPTLEAAVFVKLSAFVIIQTFFVSAISGSISAELSNILDNPEELINLLANSLPAQSSYFIQIIFVFTFFVHGLELLRIHPLGVALLRRFIGPNLTKKEKRTTWKFLNSLEDPPAFFHAETCAQMGLFFVVYFVYANIAPITCLFLVVCFAICETGYRYHFIHNHKPTPDSGGKIWKSFVQVLLVSMLIGQLTLLGFLALKRAVYALPAMAPLMALTVLHMIFVVPKQSEVSNNLPTSMCVELDRRFNVTKEKNGDDGDDDEETGGVQNSSLHRLLHDFKKLQYLQPALQDPRLYPEEEDD